MNLPSMSLSGLFAVDSMRTSDTEFGIVPTPKYNEAQERYYAFNHGCAPCSIVKTAKDPEMSAHVLEALNYLSSGSTVPCYCDQVLKGKVARDSESTIASLRPSFEEAFRQFEKELKEME